MEFAPTPPIWWSNKRGAPEIDFLNVLTELVDNYHNYHWLQRKNNSAYFFPPLVHLFSSSSI
jgi:hypothetical protein